MGLISAKQRGSSAVDARIESLCACGMEVIGRASTICAEPQQLREGPLVLVRETLNLQGGFGSDMSRNKILTTPMKENRSELVLTRSGGAHCG